LNPIPTGRGLDHDVTICVLLYGDFPDYAARCLNSIFNHVGADGIRVWGNAVEQRTEALLDGFIDRGLLRIENVVLSSVNRCKYPVIREFIFNEDYQVRTNYMMWFDDDSYVATTHPDWLPTVMSRAKRHDVTGSPFTCSLTANQKRWARAQPWYRDKPIPMRTLFAVGGWWVARCSTFRAFNWPLPELRHNGGDVVLGELMHQNNLSLGRYSAGVKVNADWDGVEAKAERRGYREPPIGSHYRGEGL